MIRISMSFFYGLGASLRRIADIKPDVPLDAAWVPLYEAKRELEKLFAADWFLPAVKSAYQPGQNLLAAIDTLTQRTDFSSPMTHPEVYSVAIALEEFGVVLRNELAVADAYFVTRKVGYDTPTLINFKCGTMLLSRARHQSF